MINLSNDLIITSSGHKLHKVIESSIQDTSRIVLEIANSYHNDKSIVKTKDILEFIGKKNRVSGKNLDEFFLKAASAFSQLTSVQAGSESLNTLYEYFNSKTISATKVPTLKRFLKIVLTTLWRKGELFLPWNFLHRANVIPYEAFNSELLNWILSLKQETIYSPEWNLSDYGPRLLFATNWHRPEEVSLIEIAEMHRELVLRRNKVEGRIGQGSVMFPFHLFASKLLETFGDRISFDAKDLLTYSKWQLNRDIVNYPLEAYISLSNSERIESKNTHPRVEVADIKATTIQDRKILGENSVEVHSVLANKFKTVKRHALSKYEWWLGGTEIAKYPEREHVDNSKISEYWIIAFKAYLYHRKYVKEYRSDGEIIGALKILTDYLFYYLPWWKEVVQSNSFDIPKSPREFVRYLFVSRSSKVAQTELPLTLIDCVALRRSKESKYATIRQLCQFFDFVGTEFSDNEEISGSTYRSPLNLDFDLPPAKKKSKSNKEVIPKDIYGYFLFYCYEVEKFGMHLEDQARKGILPMDGYAVSRTRTLNSSIFGFTPKLKFRDRELPLHEVPNVFSWQKRELVSQDGTFSEAIRFPHSSALRLLTTSVETGLRCQSVQWLDMRTWDCKNIDASPKDYIYTLLVNTDKTKTESWEPPVVYRVREMLQREQDFQMQFSDAKAFAPVLYEGSDVTPFAPIVPLFRKPDSGKPVHDTIYSNVWQQLMVHFESFLRTQAGYTHIKLYSIKPVLTKDGAVKINYADEERMERPYSVLTISLVHTPHACRVTFATNRQGLLTLSDRAELLGHANEIVTAHYTKLSAEQLADSLQASDESITSDFLAFDANAADHIRADKEDSALARSFHSNRSGTIKKFKFIPSIALWSTKDVEAYQTEGVRLLQEGPMSRIRFRETHICPVGEECPSDIIEQIGEPKRCGICPLAMKCIDHLTAMTAKCNQLVERIKYLHK